MDVKTESANIPGNIPWKGTECFAINCSHYANSYWRARGITMHRFPNKDKSLECYAIWERESRRDKKPSKNTSLCSAHFDEKWFYRTGQIVRLRKGAIPSKFSLPKHLQKKSTVTRTTANSHKEDANVMATNDAEEDPKFDVRMDHNYGGEPLQWKRKCEDLTEKLNERNKVLKNAKRRETRAKKTCEGLLNELQEKNLINEEIKIKLDAYSNLPTELFRKSALAYTTEQKDFALTLHLQSAKAYNYLREQTKFPLPHPRTLRRWMQSVDCSPGINMAMIQVLKEKREHNPDQYTRCCLLLDAMAIRHHIDYLPHKEQFLGYVDIGDGPNLTTEAKEALVCMLDGVAGHWKVPVAHFLTATLTAESQGNLVRHLVSQLEDLGFHVVAITMDGHATNVAMASLLGANIDFKNPMSLKPYFTSDGGNKIYIMFDICHMMKLLQNTWHIGKLFLGPSGNILWRNVEELHYLQKSAGLHLANKLSNRHIEFAKNKMKVSTAVQVFSASVAKALQAAKEMGLTAFQECIPTVEFIEQVDELFDTLNSRSPLAKGFKSPTNSNNIGYKMEFMKKMKGFLLSLKTADGLPLFLSRRGMCIKGLVIGMDVFCQLSVELLQHQKYILYYKLSQDHLELFFNAIRRTGGWNNNPTAKTFIAAMRKITTHCGALTASSNDNCQQLDGTEIVQCGSTTYIPPNHEESHEDPFEPELLANMDHGYTSNLEGSLVANASVYIAGWVVQKLMPQISCVICRASLVSSSISQKYGSSSHLLRLKQNGGLVFPTDDVINIVLTTEKFIRQMEDINKPTSSLTLLCTQKNVLAALADDVFQSEHALETSDGINNHNISLIRLIVKSFFTLRMHHISKIKNESMTGKSVRHSLNKVTKVTKCL